jgi:hypothetical protein
MWWPAGSDEERALRATVHTLLARYRELLTMPGDLPLRGIGAGAADPTPRSSRFALGRPSMSSSQRESGPGFAQQWLPLVLVDAALMQPVPPDVRRLNWRSVDPRSPVGQALQALEPPPNCIVEPIGPLAAAVAPGCTTAASGVGVATVGLPVSITDPNLASTPQGFLTVAHGVPDPNLGQRTTVTVANRAGSALTGDVAFWDESARLKANGDDIALVALRTGQLAGWLVNTGTQPAPAGPPYATLPVDLYAGQSHNVVAHVSGALLQLGDQTWQWLDCWELGATTPAMRPGDSGALAVGPAVPHTLFGHFVGGAVSLRGGGFTHHWVQDLGQVLQRQPILRKMITY